MTFASLQNQDHQMQSQTNQFKRYENMLPPPQQQNFENQPENEISQGQLELQRLMEMKKDYLRKQRSSDVNEAPGHKMDLDDLANGTQQ